jgi:hypothetical protein
VPIRPRLTHPQLRYTGKRNHHPRSKPCHPHNQTIHPVTSLTQTRNRSKNLSFTRKLFLSSRVNELAALTKDLPLDPFGAIALDRVTAHIQNELRWISTLNDHPESENHAEPEKLSHRMRANTSIPSFLICVSLLLPFLPVRGLAQQVSAFSSSVSLPDAPLPQQNNSPAGAASVSGIVQDTDGAAIPNAQVALFLSDGRQLQTVKSDAYGRFMFTGVPTGSYYATAEAPGFAPIKTKELTIAAQQSYVLPEISLAIAGLNTNVTVRPTEVVAAEQIKAQEQQRMLGVLPNFYVSYVPDAAPLTSKQKFSLASHEAFDWTRFVGISAGAGLEQATDTFSDYGQGASGYGKRWGALFATGTSSTLLSRYVFASLLHQDPRYFYQGTGTKKSRLYHAVSSAFVARSDSGKTMPNYSYLLGNISAAALSNTYYPESNRGAGLIFTNAALGIAGRAMANTAQEFIGKRLTKNTPQTDLPADAYPVPTSASPKSSGKKSATVPDR